MIRKMTRTTLIWAVALLGGCGESPPARSLRDADRSITALDVTGPNINVQLDMADNHAASVHAIGSAIRNIGRAIQAGAPGPTPETTWIQMSVRFAGDDFGNLRFPIADLRKAKFDLVDAIQALNLSDMVTPGTGTAFDRAIEYCADESIAAVSQSFCAQVRKSR